MPMPRDYGKETVATLRAILRERGIASTGLTRKQQIVERLEEEDAAVGGEEGGGGERQEGTEEGAEGAEGEGKGEGEGEGEGQGEEHASPASSVTIQAREGTQERNEPKEVDGEEGKEAEGELTEKADEQEEQQQGREDEEKTPTQGEGVPLSTTQTAESAADSVTQEPTVTSTSQTPVPTREKSPPKPADQGDPELSRMDTASSLSRISSQELAEDRKKRKRRSVTPPVSTEEVERKRARQMAEVAGEVHLREDVMMNVAGTDQRDFVPDTQPSRPEGDRSEAGDGDAMDMGASEDGDRSAIPAETQDEPSQETVTADTAATQITQPLDMETDRTEEPRLEESAGDSSKHPEPFSTSPTTSKPLNRDARYKELFSATPAVPRNAAMPADRDVTPALHPATPAVYIKNFMRPLQERALRAHLVSLASPPESEPDSSVLKTFHLDSYRTHCFALFESTACASRVRRAMHHSIFPNESSRKPLWADFVPEDRINEWIEIEEDDSSTARRGMGKKWEVVYEPDADGVMLAHFQEAPPTGPGARGSISHPAAGPPPPIRTQTWEPPRDGPPTGPRSAGFDGSYPSRRGPVPPSPAEDAPGVHPARRNLIDGPRNGPSPYTQPPPQHQQQQQQQQAQQQAAAAPRASPGGAAPFATLDSIFRHTDTKPKIYYQTVAPQVVDRRLDDMDRVFGRASRVSARPRPGDTLRKWSFGPAGRFEDRGGLYRPDRRRGAGPPGGGGRGGGGGRQGFFSGRGGGGGGRGGGDFYRR